MNNQSKKEAQKLFREIEPQLSKESQRLAQDVISSKDLTRLERVNKWVSEQFAKPGQPSSVIELWQNPRGRQEIRNAIKNNPNKKEIVEFLQKKTLQNQSDKIVSPDGRIDFKKLKNFVKKAEDKQIIKDLGGQDAVNFFENLESKAKEFGKFKNQLDKMANRNAEMLKRKPEVGRQQLDRVRKKNIQQAQKEMDKNKKIFEAIRREDPETAKRGLDILEQTKKKIERQDFPIVTRIEDIIEKLPVRAKKLASLLGIIKFTKPALAAEVSFAMAKNRSFRRILDQTFKTPPQNPLIFWANLNVLSKLLEDEELD